MDDLSEQTCHHCGGTNEQQIVYRKDDPTVIDTFPSVVSCVSLSESSQRTWDNLIFMVEQLMSCSADGPFDVTTGRRAPRHM